MPAPMITVENVSKIYYPDFHALKNISLTINPGEFVFFIGQSGAGKSTLMRLITAEEKPTEGKILIGDWEVTRIKKREAPYLRRQIGVVFQDFKLIDIKTVFENVAFALEVCGEPWKKIKETVPQVLRIVGLEDKATHYPKNLSGGEQQRTAIARAMVHRPKILIADEPTGDLDLITAKGIVDLLDKINEAGTTLIFVTHNRDIVNMERRRVVTLHQGEISSDRKGGKYFI